MDWQTGVAVILTLVALLVAYELLAAASRRWPTISQAVWRLTRRYPWVKWVGTVLGLVLIAHFWWGLW